MTRTLTRTRTLTLAAALALTLTLTLPLTRGSPWGPDYARFWLHPFTAHPVEPMAPTPPRPRANPGAHPAQELTLILNPEPNPHPHPHPNLNLNLNPSPSPNPNQALTPPKSDVKLIWRAQATDAKFTSYRNTSAALFGAAEPLRPQPWPQPKP